MKNVKFDFIKNSKLTVLVSLAIIVAGIVSFIVKGGLDLGIDFSGGKNIRIEISKDKNIDSEKLRNILSVVPVKPAITTIDGTAEPQFFISYQDQKNATAIFKKVMNEKIGTEHSAESTAKNISWRILSEDFVGPKIGKEFQKVAVQATLIILVILMIYIGFRFEIKFGVAAIFALLHDVLVSLAFVSIIGFKFDIPLLAAILTIIGYSLNDTIVIFDRIREESKTLHLDKHEYLMVVNTSITKSLTRTVLTSVTTLMALGVLIGFGGIELKAMSITLFVGVMAGTYSSIFIASPILVLWEKLFDKSQKKKK